MKEDQAGIGLKELIRTVHEELILSQIEREEDQIEPLFEVASLDLELNFIIKESDKTAGKFDLKVFSIGADISCATEQVHKITLHLKAVDLGGDGDPFAGRGRRPKMIDD